MRSGCCSKVMTDAVEAALANPIPFGPYLATCATLYLFAEPWLELYFRLV